MIIRSRKNLLTVADIEKASSQLREGDILILGNFKILWSLMYRGPVNHAAIYIGNGNCIHSTMHGVGHLPLERIIRDYDTLGILRIPEDEKDGDKIIQGAIDFAKQNIHKPFDFNFESSDSTLFCTELLNDAYLLAGFETGLEDVKEDISRASRLLKRLNPTIGSLHPSQLVRGHFDIIFLSHNLRVVNGYLRFEGDIKSMVKVDPQG